MNFPTSLEEITITIIGFFWVLKIVQLLFQNQQGQNRDSKESDSLLSKKLIIPTFLLVIGLGIFYGKISSELAFIFILMAGFIKLFWPLNQKDWVNKKEIHVNDIFEIEGKFAKVTKVDDHTMILSLNNTSQIFVPIQQIERLKLVNLTQEKKPYKVHFSFVTSDAVDVLEIEKTFYKIMDKEERILKSHNQRVSIVNLKNELIVFHISFYTCHYQYIDAMKNEIEKNILKYFVKENISHLHQKNDSYKKRMKEVLELN